MTTRILTGDALEQLKGLPDESVHCCVTSPPYYGLRCYDTEGQIGLEPTPEEHIARLVEVFREVRRVLRKDGVLWLNYGDAYANIPTARGKEYHRHTPQKYQLWAGTPKAKRDIGRAAVEQHFHGYKPKDLLMMPARVALALQADGWWLRSMMPWVKRSAMPESVTDRPASAIEYVFMLTKSARYFFDMEAVRTPLRASTLERGYTAAYMDGVETGKTAAAPDTVRAKENWRENGYVPAGRNFRNSDLFYTSLEPPHGLISSEDGPLALDVNPAGYSESHFATFPPKLIEPLIKAGTSEKGCCPECGAPWVREVETEFVKLADRLPGRKAHQGGMADINSHEKMGFNRSKTLDWSPSCAHGLDPVPCVILDPFLGAGTTALVSDRLGRDSIGIELNPDYAEMARKRITGDAPLFAEVEA